MKVFSPTPKAANSFFDEITFHSKNEFIHGDFEAYTSSYKVVLLQWPEQIFGWKEPSDDQLEYLSQEIQKWKKSSKIIYIVHNKKPHLGMTQQFQKLYDLVEGASDVMLHFGQYSKDYYQEKYKNKTHSILKHPLYRRSFSTHDKAEAREKLGIQEDREVVIAPGKIRTLKERNFILNAFQKIKNENKTLIAPNMFWKESKIDFIGRHRLKKVIDVKKRIENKIHSPYKPPTYIFNYNYTQADRLSLLMAAADVVFLPRMKTLNSGNLYLGLTFNKIVVGPETGNITEELKKSNFPIFQPENVDSVVSAIEKGLALTHQVEAVYNAIDLQEYEPTTIARELDQILQNITV
ncbi:MAG: hypothetical protein ACI9Y7_002246 [Dokdonia sp.]|jgi:hypothetical protein